jgi:hypothetical protein
MDRASNFHIFSNKKLHCEKKLNTTKKNGI